MQDLGDFAFWYRRGASVVRSGFSRALGTGEDRQRYKRAFLKHLVLDTAFLRYGRQNMVRGSASSETDEAMCDVDEGT